MIAYYEVSLYTDQKFEKDLFLEEKKVTINVISFYSYKSHFMKNIRVRWLMRQKYLRCWSATFSPFSLSGH